jgi:ABC-type phosphate/phosphonate transport system permease subunit
MLARLSGGESAVVTACALVLRCAPTAAAAAALGATRVELSEGGCEATVVEWQETTTVRFAVLPQVASNFASYALLRFEINVRGAAVLGFVGAGGIGQTLLEVIRKFYYADVSALLVLIIATVMLIDAVTERIRHRLLGQERAG